MFMSESPPQKKRKTGKSRKKFWRVRCPPKQRSHVLWRYPKRWFTIRESSQHPHNICVGEYDGISTHINTNFCIKHPVFLQLKWCISDFMTPPKRVEFCAGSRHIWGSPNVTFPKALTWKIAWHGLRPPLVAQEIIARTRGNMSVSATPEPFLTAGSKGKMSSSKLFNPIYCRDFSRTMSPFCFNVCNWCAEYLGFSAIRTIVFIFQPFPTYLDFFYQTRSDQHKYQITYKSIMFLHGWTFAKGKF